jgi:hypothetical protein
VSSKGSVAGISAQSLAGVWYATLGSQWAEVRVEATSGEKIKATLLKRDSSGQQKYDLEGKVLSGSKFSLRDGSGDKATASFTGELNGDHSKVTGKFKIADGGSFDAEWVRSASLQMTPYQNAQLGYSISVPVGWQSTAAENTTISPIGRQDVTCTISSTPLNGAQDVFAVFKPREDQLAAGGSYTNLGTNANALLGGKPATSWELKYQASGGPLLHAKLFGVIRGDNCLTVEGWWPVSEDDLWGPVFDRMQQDVKFSD